MLETTRGAANPYVGPRPFETGESLHGRDDELYRLVNLLMAKRIVLLYSPSGAGKTSLLQAGLLPRLERDGFRVLPVIRVNLDIMAPELASTANRYLVSTVSSLDRPLPASEQVSLSQLADMDLSAYLECRRRGNEDRRYEVLIFDQFEELLTLDPTDQNAKTAFMAQVGEALADRRRWAVFAMREEFIAALEPYLRLIPTRLSATFRLDLLGESAALTAMRAPAAGCGVTFSDSAAQLLIDELRRTRVQRTDGAREELGPYVEPVQLQVVCRQLWDRLPPDVTEVTEEHVAELGDVNTALAEYYEERVGAVAERTGMSERVIRDWFDHITEQGFRTQVLKGPDNGEDNDRVVLHALQEAHLIRAEQRRGATWYELAHDRLIAPVQASNLRWRENTLTPFQRAAITWKEYDRADALVPPDAVLDEIEPWVIEHMERLTGTERDFRSACERVRGARARTVRQAKRVRNLAVATSLLSIVALVASGAAFVSYRAAISSAKSKARAQAELVAAVDTSDHSLRSLLLQEAVRRAGSGTEPFAIAARDALYQAVYHSPPAPMFTLPTREITSMAATPDGRYVATTGRDAAQNDIQIWDLETADGIWDARAKVPVTIRQPVEVTAMAFSPDGRTLATADAYGVGRLWDWRTSANRAELDPSGNPTADTRRVSQWSKEPVHVDISVDGKWMATTSADGNATVWNVESREIVELKRDATRLVKAAFFNPKRANELAFAYGTGLVELWNLDQRRSLRTFASDAGPVHAAATNIDRTRLATAMEDGRVVVRDVASGESLRVLRHSEEVDVMAFSLDATRLATVDSDGKAVVWDLASGRTVAVLSDIASSSLRSVIFTIAGRLVIAADAGGPGIWELPAALPQGHDLELTGLALSPRGTRLVTTSADGTAKLWDTSGRGGVATELFTLPHSAVVYAAGFSTDGTHIVTASADRTAKVWDASTGGSLLTLEHDGDVTSASFNADNRTVITVSGHLARLWNASTGAAMAALAHGSTITTATFSPGGDKVVTAGGEAPTKLWDLAGQELLTLAREGASVTSAAWSPSGTRLATGDGSGLIAVWDSSSGERVAWPAGAAHADAVRAVAFSPDGSRLMTGSADYTAALWEVSTGARLQQLHHNDDVLDVSFSPNGRSMATAGEDAQAKLWEVESGREVARLNHQGSVNRIRFSSDGGTVFTASRDTTARAWDAASGAPRFGLTRNVHRHTDEVSDVEFSRDGMSLATASDDGTVRIWMAAEPFDNLRRQHDSAAAPGLLWDVAARTDSRIVAGHTGPVHEISLSPDGRHLATASADGTAKIWDVASGTAPYTLRHDGEVVDVAFSPDDRTVATASDDGTAILWDREGRRLKDPLPHDALYSLTFSPDGTQLATSGGDGAKFWDVRTGRLSGELKATRGAGEVVYTGDGKLIAMMNGASIEIREATGKHKLRRTLTAASSETEEVELTTLAFGRDDRLIAAGTVEGVIVWEVASGKQVRSVSQGDIVRGVSFAPDGRLAAAGARTEFYVYAPTITPFMVKKAAGRTMSEAECVRHLPEKRCP